MTDRTIRLGRSGHSWEVTKKVVIAIGAWIITKTLIRRLRPLIYHPIAIIGITITTWSYLTNPWLTATLFWALLIWQRGWPYSYKKHAQTRIDGYLAGLKYRWRHKRDCKALGLLTKEEPVQPTRKVRKIGCTVEVIQRMSPGDELAWWQERAKRIAQTKNALDCKVSRYQTDNIRTFRLDRFLTKPPFVQYHYEEQVVRPQWVKLELLKKDPFMTTVGAEYIRFYQNVNNVLPKQGNAVGPLRNDQPYRLFVGTHLLVISLSGYGKSTAERAMVYADYPAVQIGLIENWGFDGKKGTELGFMEHCFAHHCYADGGPQEVLQFFQDADAIVDMRLKGLRYEDVQFRPTPGNPYLDVYADEFLVLEKPEYADVRKQIYAYVWDIQLRGRAAGVRLKVFAQNPAKENFPLRDDFNEVQVGAVRSRTQVEMASPGSWERGAHAEDIEIPGVFWVQKQRQKEPHQMRYAAVTNDEIRALPQCPKSVLRPLLERELKPHVPQYGGFDRARLNSHNGNGSSSNGNGNGHKPKKTPQPEPSPEPPPNPRPDPKVEPSNPGPHPRFGGFGT